MSTFSVTNGYCRTGRLHAKLIFDFLRRSTINSVKERGRVKQIYAAFMSPWDVDEVFTSSTLNYQLSFAATNH
jgi:hypothetical protein